MEREAVSWKITRGLFISGPDMALVEPIDRGMQHAIDPYIGIQRSRVKSNLE